MYIFVLVRFGTAVPSCQHEFAEFRFAKSKETTTSTSGWREETESSEDLSSGHVG